MSSTERASRPKVGAGGTAIAGRGFGRKAPSAAVRRFRRAVGYSLDSALAHNAPASKNMLDQVLKALTEQGKDKPSGLIQIIAVAWMPLSPS